ncbi:MAG: non-ribosomal peptide synthetase, partial [Gemmatimonadetes bacterium]|nr:non-ribosomal peptide synthetase [Gemmatimonadota bacterium]
MEPKQLSDSKRALLEAMRRGRVAASTADDGIPRRPPGPAPLSFAQQRLWFIHQIDPTSPAYNVPTALRLTGRLRVDVLQRCLREVTSRHETLRTCFPLEDGIPVQSIADHAAFDLPLVDLS